MTPGWPDDWDTDRNLENVTSAILPGGHHRRQTPRHLLAKQELKAMRFDDVTAWFASGAKQARTRRAGFAS
jgi:hypothetical protein